MAETRTELQMIKMSEIQSQEVAWLWFPFIPYGKLTIVQGDPGDGKTTLVLNIAAKLSKGEGLDSKMKLTEPLNVIYQSAEDGLADTVKPRLETAGANCENISVIDESIKSLSMIDERLEEAVIRTKAKLLILDPIQAYLGGGMDMNRANEARDMTKKLATLAEKYQCAIVLVGHMNKAIGNNPYYILVQENRESMLDIMTAFHEYKHLIDYVLFFKVVCDNDIELLKKSLMYITFNVYSEYSATRFGVKKYIETVNFEDMNQKELAESILEIAKEEYRNLQGVKNRYQLLVHSMQYLGNIMGCTIISTPCFFTEPPACGVDAEQKLTISSSGRVNYTSKSYVHRSIPPFSEGKWRKLNLFHESAQKLLSEMIEPFRKYEIRPYCTDVGSWYLIAYNTDAWK